MWLSDLALPMSYAECKDLALVYPYGVALTLYTTQQEHGDPRHVVTGQPLNDGRYMIAGEMLSEVGPGGLFSWIAAYMTPEIMGQIEVVPMSEVAGLVVSETPQE